MGYEIVAPAPSPGRPAIAAGPPDRKLAVFDPRAMQSHGLVAGLTRLVIDHPRWLFALLRRFRPIPVFKGWAAVTRYDDVQEVLSRPDAFPVPFGPKVELLNDGPNFLLGMADGSDYRTLKALVAECFPVSEAASVVAPIAARSAEEIVEDSGGALDAIEGLITRVPTRICEDYYGVRVTDELAFAQWTIAMSTFMFGDPADDPKLRVIALAAGERLRDLVDGEIARAKAAPAPGSTVLSRMLALQAAGREEASDDVIRACLIGMITGFVPTNTMAAGHMLDVLLSRPDVMSRARDAALADDDDGLKRCLFEAMRFKPLNPGPFRTCADDYLVAAGSDHATTIPKGAKVLVCTQSAMFDPRRVMQPAAFDPERAPSDYLLFGFGLHWCIGAPLAEAQIVQTFKPLLRQTRLRRAPGRAGRLARLGPFPAHLHVRFDAGLL